MSKPTLVIGNKNYSSWSLRPWLALRKAGIEFEEVKILLDKPDTKSRILEHSPAGKVPVLIVDGQSIWDSLSICEWAAERRPDLWPKDPADRAHARSISAEMHSGFSALRTVWPMVFTREGLRHVTSGGVQRDIDRINDLWTSCRIEFGSGGDFLFGKFSIADAMYAPVASRFVTYGPVELSPEAAAWRDMMMALPAMKEWGDGAKAEISE